MHRLIIVGSPRVSGRCAHLADELFSSCVEDFPDDGASILSVASLDINGCLGCDACKAKKGEKYFVPEEGDPLSPCEFVDMSDSAYHHCIQKDEMAEVRKHLDAADELIVVAPLYFEGAPAQFKALIDRLQPYYWSDLKKQNLKRPALVHVIGETKNPYGFEPLVTELSCAFGCAGFEFNTVFDWRKKISPEGEITGEPDEYALSPESPD